MWLARSAAATSNSSWWQKTLSTLCSWERSEQGAIRFVERVHDVVIADNICYRSGDANTVLVVSVEHHTVGENRNVIIDGNIIVNDNNVADGGTLSLRAVSGATVHGNMLMNKVNTASKGWTVRIEETTESVMDNVVTENLGIGTNQTLIYGISGGNGNFTASDNLMRNINNGVSFGGTVLRTVLCMSKCAGSEYGRSPVVRRGPYLHRRRIWYREGANDF